MDGESKSGRRAGFVVPQSPNAARVVVIGSAVSFFAIRWDGGSGVPRIGVDVTGFSWRRRPSTSWMVRRSNTAPSSQDWYPGDEAAKRAQVAHVVAESHEEPDDAAAPRGGGAVDFVNRVSDHAPSSGPLVAPLSDRLSRCLKRGAGSAVLPCFPLCMMSMTASTRCRRVHVAGCPLPDRPNAV